VCGAKRRHDPSIYRLVCSADPLHPKPRSELARASIPQQLEAEVAEERCAVCGEEATGFVNGVSFSPHHDSVPYRSCRCADHRFPANAL